MVWRGCGSFFVVAATAQALFGLALLRWPRAWVREAGIGGNLAIAAFYLVTRMVGIPMLRSGAGDVEPFGVIDVVSKIAELALVGILVNLALRPRSTARSDPIGSVGSD